MISIFDIQAKRLFFSLNPDLDSVIEFAEAWKVIESLLP